MRRSARRAPITVLLSVLLAAAFALAGVLLSAGEADALPYSPPNPSAPGRLAVDAAAWTGHGSLAFVSRSHLYVLSPSGRLTEITGPPADGFDAQPAWSPDGRTLAVVTPGNVAIEPAWASDGALLLVTGSGSGDFATNGPAYYSGGWIEQWERTHEAWLLGAGSSAPNRLASAGPVLAFDPSAHSSAVLLVRDDVLWLATSPAAEPVRVAGPLLSTVAPSGYYGLTDWPALYSWSEAPGPSEVSSQASAELPGELEQVPNGVERD